jgi:hypothetical protein
VKEDHGMSMVLVFDFELDSESAAVVAGLGEELGSAVASVVDDELEVDVVIGFEVERSNVYSQLIVDCSLPSDRRGCTSSLRMKVYFFAVRCQFLSPLLLASLMILLYPQHGMKFSR